MLFPSTYLSTCFRLSLQEIAKPLFSIHIFAPTAICFCSANTQCRQRISVWNRQNVRNRFAPIQQHGGLSGLTGYSMVTFSIPNRIPPQQSTLFPSPSIRFPLHILETCGWLSGERSGAPWPADWDWSRCTRAVIRRQCGHYSWTVIHLSARKENPCTVSDHGGIIIEQNPQKPKPNFFIIHYTFLFHFVGWWQVISDGVASEKYVAWGGDVFYFPLFYCVSCTFGGQWTHTKRWVWITSHVTFSWVLRVNERASEFCSIFDVSLSCYILLQGTRLVRLSYKAVLSHRLQHALVYRSLLSTYCVNCVFL